MLDPVEAAFNDVACTVVDWVERGRAPYNTTDDSTTIVEKVLAEPGRQSLVLWLIFVAILTLVPGALWVGRLSRPGAPRLTAVALLLLVPGYLALPWLAARTWSCG